MNLGEKEVSSLIRMLKNALIIFVNIFLYCNYSLFPIKIKKKSTRKYKNKMLAEETCAKWSWPVKESNFQFIVSTKNSHLCQRLIVIQQKFMVWEERNLLSCLSPTFSIQSYWLEEKIWGFSIQTQIIDVKCYKTFIPEQTTYYSFTWYSYRMLCSVLDHLFQFYLPGWCICRY